jgi:hypothetical protein
VNRQAALLTSHILLRPYDMDGLIRLSLLTYEQREYKKCVKYIHRVLELAEKEEITLAGHTTASYNDIQFMHLKHAKCMVRRWMKYNENSDLEKAIASYRIAMKNKEILKRYDSYFELSGAMLKLGNTQGAFDTLGAIIGKLTN